jgi:hypothetical protein
MKKIKQFFKNGKQHWISGLDYWRKLLRDSLDELDEEPGSYYRLKKDTSCECPFCGYLGSSEEVTAHLLNHHKK